MKKIAITVLLAVLCFVLLLEPLTLAWMSDNGMGSPIDITGNVHKSYFASGNGSAEDPFEIAAPVQLYYFAWLQYLGLFNVDENEDGEIDTVYHFYLSHDLDMCYESFGETVQYILPPIGTQEYPFLGTFDGKGHTVTDLIVKNVYDENMDAPEGSTNQSNQLENIEIVGFFGVVGAYNGQSAPSSVTPTVQNVALEKLTVETQTNNALIGLVAGYVNGVVNAAGVLGATMVVKEGTIALDTKNYTSNLSDYGLVGYCTDDYKDDMYVLDLSLDKLDISTPELIVPEVGGEGSIGWGGSVTMESIYTWLYDIQVNKADEVDDYITARTDVVDLNKKIVTSTHTNGKSTDDKLVHTVENFGSFVFTTMGEGYNFMAGGMKVTKVQYEYTGINTPVYYITDGTNYLNLNGTSLSTSTTATTKWYLSDDATNKKIYTADANGAIYYLGINNNTVTVTSATAVDQSNLPVWSVNTTSGEISGSQRLIYTNGTWRVAAGTGTLYQISSGNYYLSCNGTTIQNNVTNAAEAAVWAVNISGTTATISTVVNGTTNYLRINNNSLQIGTANSNRSWTCTENGSGYTFSMRVGNTTYYLRCNNGTWSLNNNSGNASRIILTELTYTTAKTASAGTLEGIKRSEIPYVDGSLENGYYGTDGKWVPNREAGITYFPLSSVVEKDGIGNYTNYAPSKNNTGYIVSAEWGGVNSEGALVKDTYGNVRISRYAKQTTSGWGQNQTTVQNMSNATTPYTITFKTNNTFQTISDRNAATLSGLGLQKYASCYSSYEASIKDYYYGVHFMNAPVNDTSTATITASLREKTISNYEVPVNCIDFHLYDRGFINFVAGSYYSINGDENNSFFSIYEIIRNGDNSIEKVREISKIYAILNDEGMINTDEEYYYTYLVDGVEKDANNVTIDPSSVLTGDNGEKYIMVDGEKYVEVFNCRWITHPDEYGWTIRAAYYFEVPVNAGEYAIGSTTGRTGAYLVYLDLAANVQQFERTEIYEEITEGTLDTTIPQGVDWLTAKPTGEGDDTLANAINPWNSAFVQVTTDASGNIVFGRVDITTDDGGNIVFEGADGKTVTYWGVYYDDDENKTPHYFAPDGVLPGYIGINNVLKKYMQPVVIDPVLIKRPTYYRTTYYDYNVNTKATTVTVITVVNDVKNVTYATYDVNGQPVTLDVPIYPDKWINKLENYQKLSDLIDLTAIVKWEKPTPTEGEVTPPLALDTEKTKFSAEFSRSSGAVATLSSKVYDIYLTCADDVVGDLKASLTDTGVNSGITFNVYINDAKVATLTSSTTSQPVSINTTTEAEPPAEQP